MTTILLGNYLKGCLTASSKVTPSEFHVKLLLFIFVDVANSVQWICNLKYMYMYICTGTGTCTCTQCIQCTCI